MRPPRLRVRTYMVGVGLVALLIWGTVTAGWAYHYYQRASFYGASERLWRDWAAEDLARGATRTAAAKWGLQIADYYAPLARKYRRAMWRPWTRVGPDPPPPPEIKPSPAYIP